ncbi:hypothetical protein [Kangiella koreensis]|uniref:Uncharacterized protein n=1 Tax=Kangiella koreensis (strain DSM 16069 / JCM 12317 / KCTC 12182 / SW-125) TaxID=523791 RepID=C7R8P9_KANKD|nr:hypothetical protein [Kangiella koreensis]ACV25912.1 hypothetical protein Kkor_0492 [Kangiella koreensis DSM 16069]
MDKHSDNKDLIELDAEHEEDDSSVNKDTWDRTRELILLQVKLGIDAIRDFVLIPVALFCYILDFGERDKSKPSYWDRLMAWGRRSDHHINLFKHRRSYKKGYMTIDDAMNIVEETIRKEVKNGDYSEQVVNKVKDKFKNRGKH